MILLDNVDMPNLGIEINATENSFLYLDGLLYTILINLRHWCRIKLCD